MARAKKMAFGGPTTMGPANMGPAPAGPLAARPGLQNAIQNRMGPAAPPPRPMAPPMASQMATTSLAPAAMKKGGMVRGDGIAIRGKTKGRCC